MGVLNVSLQSEGSVEHLSTVAADCGADPHVQGAAVHLVLVLQVSHHLLAHGVPEHSEAVRLRTLVVAACQLLLMCRMVLEQVRRQQVFSLELLPTFLHQTEEVTVGTAVKLRVT